MSSQDIRSELKKKCTIQKVGQETRICCPGEDGAIRVLCSYGGEVTPLILEGLVAMAVDVLEGEAVEV